MLVMLHCALPLQGINDHMKVPRHSSYACTDGSDAKGSNTIYRLT